MQLQNDSKFTVLVIVAFTKKKKNKQTEQQAEQQAEQTHNH